MYEPHHKKTCLRRCAGSADRQAGSADRQVGSAYRQAGICRRDTNQSAQPHKLLRGFALCSN